MFLSSGFFVFVLSATVAVAELTRDVLPTSFGVANAECAPFELVVYRNAVKSTLQVNTCQTYAELLSRVQREFAVDGRPDESIDAFYHRTGVRVDDLTSMLAPYPPRDELTYEPFLIAKALREPFMYPAQEIGERVPVPVGDRTVTLETVALTPRVFIIPDYFADGETEQLIEHAVSLDGWIDSTVGDTYATRQRNNYRESRQVWVGPNGKTHSATSTAVRGRAHELTKIDDDLFEDVQVVKYVKGGHYYGHPDASEIFPDVPYKADNMYFRNGGNRHLTLLYYLRAPESGGWTAFPFAHGANRDPAKMQEVYQKGRTNALCTDMDDVMKVTPQQGAAVLFYSLVEGQQFDGILDRWSYHSGCDVGSGEKWIGNQWIRNKRVYNEKTGKWHMYDNIW